MADEEEKKENEEKEKKPKKDSKIGMLIGVIVVVILAQLIVAFIVVKITAPKSEAPETEQTSEADSSEDGGDISNVTVANEQILPDEFEQVVNIAGTDGMRFLKVGIALAYDADSKANAKFVTSYTANVVRIRNHIVQYLSSLTLEQVQDRNVQKNIRRDLLRELNKQIPANSGEFSNVYLTVFLIQ